MPDDREQEPAEVPVVDPADTRRDAAAKADAGRMPTPDEERAADQHGDVDESVIDHERDMNKRGAHQQGEGRIG